MLHLQLMYGCTLFLQISTALYDVDSSILLSQFFDRSMPNRRGFLLLSNFTMLCKILECNGENSETDAASDLINTSFLCLFGTLGINGLRYHN